MTSGYYVPLELEDFGLNPYEYVFYCRVTQFSSNGKCREPIDRIAKICAIDRKSAYKAAKSLEAHRLISVSRSNGLVNEIVLTPVSSWISMSENVEDAESDSTGFVYLAHAIGSNRYKIGCSKDVAKRIRQLNKQSAFSIEAIHYIFSDRMNSLESEFHQKFDQYRANGEWFELNERSISDFMNHSEGK